MWNIDKKDRDFPGGPVAKTLLPMQGPELDPRSANYIPHVAAKEPESLKENLW